MPAPPLPPAAAVWGAAAGAGMAAGCAGLGKGNSSCCGSAGVSAAGLAGAPTSANWTIQNAGSSYCIGVKAGATTNGSLTILYSCNAHTDQEWIPQSNGTLLNLKSGKCLDDPSDSTTNGTQQQIWTCNTNPQQNWTLP